MGRLVAQITKTHRELADAWRRFWFSETDPTTLCVLRILVGGMLVYTVGVWGLRFDAFLGEYAWNSPELLNELQTPGVAPSFWWYVPEAWTTTVHWLSMSVLVMFMLGFCTRVTSILSLVILVSYSYRAHISNYGLDQINAILTFYLCLAPCAARFSVDSLIRSHRGGVKLTGSAIPRSASANLATRLIQVHFCVIYSFAALAKLQGEGWWNGEAIWMALANTEYQTIDMTWVAWHPWISDLATHGSMLFELTFWVLVWGRFRPVVLFAGALLHLCIGAMMGMWTFALIMIFGHVAFWHPVFVNRILKRVSRTRGTLMPHQPRVVSSKSSNSRRKLGTVEPASIPFPVAKPPAVPVAKPPAVPVVKPTQLVCVDCDKSTRSRCVSYFTQHGFECYATDNPEASVRLCETLRPQAIIIVGRSLADSALLTFHEQLTLRSPDTLALYILSPQQVDRLAVSLDGKSSQLVDASRSVHDVRRLIENAVQRSVNGQAVATSVLSESDILDTEEDEGSWPDATSKKPR